MKKIILSVLLSVFYLTSSSAEIGVNVGISGSAGLFAVSGKEAMTSTEGGQTTKGSEHGEAAFGSIFIEKTIGDRFAIGIDYVPSSLSTETAESQKLDTTEGTQTAGQNKIQIDFEDLTTYYVAINVFDSMYVKAGMVTVDIITNESLTTGSTYGNTDMDGTLFGVGYNKSFDSGMFIRVEGNYMDFDGASVTGTGTETVAAKVSLNQLHGLTGKLSVGKSF
tara:strand:+ start:315 stop:980 length:666 start_codon:yes stop_codon:yes gene_type:complete